MVAFQSQLIILNLSSLKSVSNRITKNMGLQNPSLSKLHPHTNILAPTPDISSVFCSDTRAGFQVLTKLYLFELGCRFYVLLRDFHPSGSPFLWIISTSPLVNLPHANLLLSFSALKSNPEIPWPYSRPNFLLPFTAQHFQVVVSVCLFYIFCLCFLITYHFSTSEIRAAEG